VTPAEEDRIVAKVLKIAEDQDPVELKGEASLSAYEALARSRGVDLEVVLRAHLRDELRRVVELPPVVPVRYGSGPVTSARADDVDGDGDGDTTCGVVD